MPVDAEYCPQCKTRKPARKTGILEFVPWWGGIFIVACGAIPLLTMGGAIPTALGIGCAAACASISKKPNMPVMARVVYCAGVTIGAWGAFLLLLAGMERLQR
jgi:hypothetical protein